jgi:hypothetical protein
MKNLSFWQWFGIIIIIGLLGKWVFLIVNGKELVQAQKELDLRQT